MRSPVIICTVVHLLLVVFTTAHQLHANPVAPMPVTKVYFLDSQHWTIEFKAGELGLYPIPAQTDTVTLGCAPDAMSSIPMHKSTLPIKINTDSGTGLVTSTHFPDVKLVAGSRIFMGVKNDKNPDYGPLLPSDIQPNTTIELKIEATTCTELIGTTVHSYSCTKRGYVTSTCPQTYTPSNVYILGLLTNTRNAPLSGFSVRCFSDIRKPPVVTVVTNTNGLFVLPNLALCPSHILQFTTGTFKIDYPVKPLSSENQLTVNCTLQINYPPSGSNQQKTVPEKDVPRVRLLASSGSNANPIVITISDNSLQGKGWCELYTLDGELMRSLAFTSIGSGTYSIAWEGTDGNGRPVPAATYLCRIKIGPEYLCKTFITR